MEHHILSALDNISFFHLSPFSSVNKQFRVYSIRNFQCILRHNIDHVVEVTVDIFDAHHWML